MCIKIDSNVHIQAPRLKGKVCVCVYIYIYFFYMGVSENEGYLILGSVQ